MKARRIFAFLTAATMLFAAGCTPLPGMSDSEAAAIAVTPTSYSTTLEGGETSFSVTSNAAWVATPSVEDVVVSPLAGTGNSTIKVTVPASTTSREFTIKLVATKTQTLEGFTFPSTAEAVITISQNESGVDMNDYVYYENCGEDVEKDGNYWPYVDQFEGWSPQGEGQSGVTYSGNNASVRASGQNYYPTEDAIGISNQPYVFLNKKPSECHFDIQEIVIGGGKNYVFSFNVSCQNGYSGTPSFAEVTNDLVQLQLGYDGENWAPVQFVASPNGGNGWYTTTTEFKVKADATKLYARFTYDAPASNGGCRIDDFKLVEGGNGAELEIAEKVVVTGTVAEVLAGEAGEYIVNGAWVVATYANGFLMTDSSKAYILAYNPSVTPAVGSVINIQGGTTEYGGFMQFAAGAVVTETGETKEVNHGTATAMTGAALDEWLNNLVVKYVTYEGRLEISNGKYYNVYVDGAATAIGSVQYPNDELKTKLTSLDGKNIKVTGYLIGKSSDKYANTMAVEVVETEGGETPDTPDTPDVPGDAKTLPYTETFSSSLGDFTINDVLVPEGTTYVWKQDSNYGNISASAYINKTNCAAESWLISPQISLSGATAPEVSFDHTHRYAGTPAEELTLWVSVDNTENWTQVTIPTYATNNDNNFVTATIDLTSYVGKTINVAFKYVSSTAAAGTWRIKNFKVAEKAAEPETPEIPDTIEGGITVTLATNGGTGANIETITFTTEPITIVVDKNSHTTSPRLDADYVRVYGTADMHNSYTITSTTATKKKIVKANLTCTTAGYATALAESAITTAAGESVVAVANNTIVTIYVADGTESIKIEPSAQFRTSTVDVIYTE